jgi:hypothetical protein
MFNHKFQQKFRSNGGSQDHLSGCIGNKKSSKATAPSKTDL